MVRRKEGRMKEGRWSSKAFRAFNLWERMRKGWVRRGKGRKRRR